MAIPKGRGYAPDNFKDFTILADNQAVWQARDATITAALELDLPGGANNMNSSRIRKIVALPQIIDVQRQFFTQNFINANTETVSRKAARRRIVKRLFGCENL
jgi:hypothetical protein